MMHSGLCGAGALFVKNYTSHKFAGSSSSRVKKIIEYADEFYQSIQFDTILCNDQLEFDPEGTRIPSKTENIDDT